MIDTKARTIPQIEPIIGAEVEIDGKRLWISKFIFHRNRGWVISFSVEPPPEWLTR